MDTGVGAVDEPHEGLRQVDDVHVVAVGHESTASVRARFSGPVSARAQSTDKCSNGGSVKTNCHASVESKNGRNKI